jgi:hypothetical protein
VPISNTNVDFSSSNPFIVPYNAPVDFLSAAGSHQAAHILCAIAPILGFQLVRDGPLTQQDLIDPLPQCLPPVTPPPTMLAPPGDAPTPSSANTSALSSSSMLVAAVFLLVDVLL